MSTISALVASATIAGLAAAPAPATPTYQVKLRLAPSAVTATGEPTAATKDLLGVQGEPKEEQFAYAVLPKNGWSVRIRHKDGEGKFDLTYKHRTPMTGSEEDALAQAAKEGFGAEETDYEAQVNTSYRSSTLDFSNKKSKDCDPCRIPAERDSLKILADKAPGKFEKSGATLEGASMSKTATQRTWSADGADLEVTGIGGGYYVEVTAETDDRSESGTIRQELIQKLDRASLLMHEDAFKTSHVIEDKL